MQFDRVGYVPFIHASFPFVLIWGFEDLLKSNDSWKAWDGKKAITG